MARTPKTTAGTDAEAADPLLNLPPDMVAEDAAAEAEDVAAGPAAPVEAAVLFEDPVSNAVPEAEAPQPGPPEPVYAVIPPLPVPPPAPAPIVIRRAGFVPMILGGVLAAAIGFAAAWVYRDLTAGVTTAALAAQDARIATLESAPAPDLAPLADVLTALETALADQSAAQSSGLAALGADLGTLQSGVTGLSDRLTALERAPAADGSLSTAAIASWQAEIDALRATLADESARITVLMEDLAAAPVVIEPVVDTAATEAALLATRRAAMDRILAALDAGTPFAAPLSDLAASGATIAAALTGPAADGVVTLAALTGTFPDAARAALSIARDEGLAEESSGITAFLRNQFDVRSVSPRDGADPDAVLSRAEAALRDGRLSDAMAEVASLPEVVRAEMAPWIAGAEARLAALAAATVLSETLTTN